MPVASADSKAADCSIYMTNRPTGRKLPTEMNFSTSATVCSATSSGLPQNSLMSQYWIRRWSLWNGRPSNGVMTSAAGAAAYAADFIGDRDESAGRGRKASHSLKSSNT